MGVSRLGPSFGNDIGREQYSIYAWETPQTHASLVYLDVFVALSVVTLHHASPHNWSIFEMCREFACSNVRCLVVRALTDFQAVSTLHLKALKVARRDSDPRSCSFADVQLIDERSMDKLAHRAPTARQRWVIPI